VSGILALYTGAWVWVCWKIFPLHKSLSKNHPLSPALSPWERERERSVTGLLQETSWRQRTTWALGCACAWVAMEMGITRIFTGFPWNLLGASQYKVLPLIQIASVTGVYGVSFLVVWMSVSSGCAAVVAWRRRASQEKAPEDRPTPRRWCESLAEIGLPFAVVLAVVGFGFKRLARPEPAGGELKVALVQPSIPQTVIWDRKEQTNRFNKLVALSEQALATQPDLLVWPEAALPQLLNRFNRLTYDAITNLVVPHKIWMILGADDAQPRKNAASPDEAEFFNGSFLVDPSGELVAKYYKRHLVMLGEYLPLVRRLPGLKHFRWARAGFTAGVGPVPFQLGGLKVKISVLICFEDVFPHLVRESVEPDTDFLLNLTNNGWFGESAAQWQHAVSALFRAVENGLPLVRCTNNGLTCWIDARGRLRAEYFPGSRDIYQAGFKLARIPLRGADGASGRTIYNRYGDWFGWLCVGLTSAALVCSWHPARRRLSPSSAVRKIASLICRRLR